MGKTVVNLCKANVHPQLSAEELIFYYYFLHTWQVKLITSHNVKTYD